MLLVAVAIGWAVYVTQAIGGMPLSGWLAMILGIVFTVVIGVGLMALVFYSSRKGHDDPPRWQ